MSIVTMETANIVRYVNQSVAVVFEVAHEKARDGADRRRILRETVRSQRAHRHTDVVTDGTRHQASATSPEAWFCRIKYGYIDTLGQILRELL